MMRRGRVGVFIALAFSLSACGGHTRLIASPGNCGHIDAEGFVLDLNGEPLVTGWHDRITGAIDIPRGVTIRGISVRFLAADSTLFEVSEMCRENSLTVTVMDPLMAVVERESHAEWTFDVVGVQAGQTFLKLRAWHDTHVHVEWVAIPVRITEGQDGT